jgi:hypothetical protein
LYDDLTLKVFPGSLTVVSQQLLMIKMLLLHHHHIPTTSKLHDSIVWRQSVLHVVL